MYSSAWTEYNRGMTAKSNSSHKHSTNAQERKENDRETNKQWQH